MGLFGDIGKRIGGAFGGGIIGGQLPGVGAAIGAGVGDRFRPRSGGPRGPGGGGPGDTNIGPDFSGEISAINAQKAPQIKGVTNPTLNKEALGGEFDLARKRVLQQSRSAGQQAQDAIKRRFARIGALGSGAFIKASQKAQSDIQGQTGEQLANIDAQKNRALAELEFKAAESAAGREQQRNLAQADIDFRNKVFKFDAKSKLRQLDVAIRQQLLDSIDQEFNRRQAAGLSGETRTAQARRENVLSGFRSL